MVWFLSVHDLVYGPPGRPTDHCCPQIVLYCCLFSVEQKSCGKGFCYLPTHGLDQEVFVVLASCQSWVIEPAVVVSSCLIVSSIMALLCKIVNNPPHGTTAWSHVNFHHPPPASLHVTCSRNTSDSGALEENRLSGLTFLTWIRNRFREEKRTGGEENSNIKCPRKVGGTL